MKWTFPRPLNGLELVKLIEQDYKIKLPSLYIEIIKDGNAEIPEKKYLTVAGKRYDVGRLISANITDSPNILNAIGWLEQSANVKIPIFINQFGDLVYLQYFNRTSYTIAIQEYDTGKIVDIVGSFEDLIANLSC